MKKKVFLFLTVILFTLTANAGSFSHTCSSTVHNGFDQYSEDIYIDSWATVAVSLSGGTPVNGNASADLHIYNLDTFDGYANTTWGITNIPSSIPPGNWQVVLNADGDGGSCSINISW